MPATRQLARRDRNGLVVRGGVGGGARTAARATTSAGRWRAEATSCGAWRAAPWTTPNERVRVVDHLVAVAREHQPVLRRAAARAAHDVRVHLLIARARPLRPAVRPFARARRVRRPPERAAVAKLGVGAAAEVILAAQPLVNRPLRRPFRRAALAIGEADVEVAARRGVVQSVDQVVRLQRMRLEQRVEVGAHRHVAVDHRHVEPGLLDDARHVVVARVPQPAASPSCSCSRRSPTSSRRRRSSTAAASARGSARPTSRRPSECSIPTARSEKTRLAIHAVPASLPYVRMSSPFHARAAAAFASSPGASRSPPRYGQLAERRVRRRRRRARSGGHIPSVAQLRRQRVPRRALRRRRDQVVVAARRRRAEAAPTCRRRRARRPPRRRAQRRRAPRRRGGRWSSRCARSSYGVGARVPVGVAQRGADRADIACRRGAVAAGTRSRRTGRPRPPRRRGIRAAAAAAASARLQLLPPEPGAAPPTTSAPGGAARAATDAAARAARGRRRRRWRRTGTA